MSYKTGYRHEFPVTTDFSELIDYQRLQIIQTGALMADFWRLPKMEDDNVSLPIYTFLPPTDEISSLRLLLCTGLVLFVTATLACNVASLVMQFFTRRFSTDYPVQHFIASIYATNSLLPFFLPSLILDRLVKVWMFGSITCSLYYFVLAYLRIILPWTIVVVSFQGYLQLAHKRSNLAVVGSVVFIGILFGAFVLPLGLATAHDWIIRREHNESSFIMLVHFSSCETTEVPDLFFDLAIEVLLPLLSAIIIALLVIFKIYGTADEFEEHRTKYVKVALLQVIAICLTTLGNIGQYIPRELQTSVSVSYDTNLGELLSLVPFIGTAVYWAPLCYCSAYYNDIMIAELRAKESKSSTEMSMMRLLQPDDARREF